MITKQIFLLSLFILVIRVSTAFSQEYDSDSVQYTPISKSTPKLKEEVISKQLEYFFNIQTGTLVGCNDCDKGKEFTFSVTTVQGVTIGNKFRAGIGIGFDSYQNWQTLPLYGMASWDLVGDKNKNALFVQVNYGWAHPWFVRDGSYSYYSFDPFTNVGGGRMLNPQIGYRVSYYNLKLSIVAGYKFQSITYKKPYYYCPACDFSQTSYDEVTQDMNRVQLMMSVGWR
ncbi:MAG TPA: hypothetical protein VGQ59_13375 [Cyclobacteriaceae bacterium]|jgi:hypothetical protein|nr:hypothetical protein [Cyclobacteriaceae bacterium]